ncbi:MAG: septal ring lytic transglycosylase RlpA family protein [Acidobacteriaceae bacterium]|nr:septal ring lytic transglycosylase RlpA family protein [Acidobacteriaceae bacterium]
MRASLESAYNLDDIFWPSATPALAPEPAGDAGVLSATPSWRWILGVAVSGSLIATGLSLGAVSGVVARSMRAVFPIAQPSSAVVVSPAAVEPPMAPEPVLSQSAASSASKAPRITKTLRGMATWYGGTFQGRPTTSGEIFDENLLTACNNTLPFGTLVKVTDLHTMKSVTVRINDRGFLSKGRIIDLSSAAARRLGILQEGVASVKLEVIGRVSSDTWSRMQQGQEIALNKPMAAPVPNHH